MCIQQMRCVDQVFSEAVKHTRFWRCYNEKQYKAYKNGLKAINNVSIYLSELMYMYIRFPKLDRLNYNLTKL